MRALLGSFLVFICASLPVASASIALDLKVKAIVQGRVCVQCHTPGLPTSRKGALRVFNLSRPDWYAPMTSRQLQRFQARMLNQLSAAEMREMGETGAEVPLSGPERALVIEFVLTRTSE